MTNFEISRNSSSSVSIIEKKTASQVETLPEIIQVEAASLPTEIGPTQFSGMQYCDLLSPYRALEHIYILSVLNGNPY